jgi:two-component system CheB/CheR fusion protein
MSDSTVGIVELAQPPVLVVGIGASAGGPEALQAFFSTLPTNELAFVIVAPIEPAEHQQLPEIVKRATTMPLVEIQSRTGTGIELLSGHIYLTPLRSLVEMDGATLTLNLSEAEQDEGFCNPVDNFFRSLAEARHAGAVGIILSGNGTDGTLGLKAISDAGGMTIAQDPATAKYDSMPRNASTLGMADRTLPPEKIAEELLAYARHVTALTGNDRSAELNQQISDALVAICEVLQDATEHNFKHYKTSTLVRRIGRRMQVLRITSADEYVARMKESRDEVSALFKELLIGVTAFFRDPEAFESLEQIAIPSIL